MTYEEAKEIAVDIFNEYMPKVNPSRRDEVIALLFTELVDHGVLDLEDEIEEQPEEE